MENKNVSPIIKTNFDHTQIGSKEEAIIPCRDLTFSLEDSQFKLTDSESDNQEEFKCIQDRLVTVGSTSSFDTAPSYFEKKDLSVRSRKDSSIDRQIFRKMPPPSTVEPRPTEDPIRAFQEIIQLMMIDLEKAPARLFASKLLHNLDFIQDTESQQKIGFIIKNYIVPLIMKEEFLKPFLEQQVENMTKEKRRQGIQNKVNNILVRAYKAGDFSNEKYKNKKNGLKLKIIDMYNVVFNFFNKSHKSNVAIKVFPSENEYIDYVDVPGCVDFNIPKNFIFSEDSDYYYTSDSDSSDSVLSNFSDQGLKDSTISLTKRSRNLFIFTNAIMDGNTKKFEAVLLSGTVDINDSWGACMPLAVAWEYEQFEILDLLLKQENIKIDIPTEVEDELVDKNIFLKALKYAITNKSSSILWFLLNKYCYVKIPFGCYDYFYLLEKMDDFFLLQKK